ncbi:tautomerase family protein [Agarivorans sp. QJM3NY_29]|uniref:tautomerase family protein n=1 Tax=unclassified Agarivorans TaxID=2636026 RepID=UPI003D7E6902
MPMVRISLLRGHNRSYKQKLSQILQQSLASCFAVPTNDCFQLFDEYESENRVIHPTYLSPGRSDDYVLIQITAGRPRSSLQKQNLYQQLAEQCQQQLDLAPADLMVVICFNHAEDWSFSQGQIFTTEAL